MARVERRRAVTDADAAAAPVSRVVGKQARKVARFAYSKPPGFHLQIRGAPLAQRWR